MSAFEEGGITLTLDGDRFTYSPNETLAGTVRWALAEPPRRLALRLLWYTTGKGDQDVGVAETQELDGPAAREERRFRFALPPAPHSFSGALISLQWALEATAEPGGETARVELVLAPGGLEKRLPTITEPPPQLPRALAPLAERLAVLAARRRDR